MNGMVGVITGKDVLKNSLTIVRLWGPKCYLRLGLPRSSGHRGYAASARERQSDSVSFGLL